MSSYHQILEVPFGSDLETIKSAYKSLAKSCHPDLHPGDDKAAERFIKITEAYNALISEFPGQKPIPMGREHTPTSSGKSRPTLRRTVALHVSALLSGVTLKLDDAASVCEACHGTGQRKIDHLVDCLACMGRGYDYREKGIIRLKIQCVACDGKGKCDFMPCEVCGGFGATAATRGTVTIPKETLPGSIINIKGGAVDPVSGQVGDLEVVVDQIGGDPYWVEGADILYNLPLDIWDLVLGTKVPVALPRGGVVNLSVPPDTRVGRSFKLAGGGFRNDPGQPGDFIVVVQLKPLDGRTPSIREALLKLKQASGC